MMIPNKGRKGRRKRRRSGDQRRRRKRIGMEKKKERRSSEKTMLAGKEKGPRGWEASWETSKKRDVKGPTRGV